MSDQVIAIDAYFGHLARIADTAHIEDSMILNEARVYGDVNIRHSRICHVSTVGEHAEIDHSFTYNKSRVTGSSRVLEGSAIFHLAQVSDEAVLKGVKMFNHSRVSGKATVEQSSMTENLWVDGEARVDNCTLSGPTLITGNSSAKGCTLESVVLCHGAKLENVNKSRKWYCGLEENGTKNLGKRLLFSGYADIQVQEHLQLHDIAPYDDVGDAGEDAAIDDDERKAMDRAEVFQAGEGSHTPLKSAILATERVIQPRNRKLRRRATLKDQEIMAMGIGEPDPEPEPNSVVLAHRSCTYRLARLGRTSRMLSAYHPDYWKPGSWRQITATIC